MDDVELNTEKLDSLIKALKDNLSTARVGILGGKASRSSSNGPSAQNNATIGARHEFGDGKMPQRSFLRVPITEYLQEYMDNTHAFDVEALNTIIRQKTIRPWIEKIAILAESIVSEAFSSGGFGKWPRWRKGYQSRTGLILVDTQQLRNSITSEVS